MGPGSSPGAGNLMYFFFRWMSFFFLLLNMLIGFTQTVLIYNSLNSFCSFSGDLNMLYSSWVLHVLFIYLMALLVFRVVISVATGNLKILN